MSANDRQPEQTLLPEDLISLTYKLEITDGRLLEGILVAVDDQSNLLITNVMETSGDIQREMGLVSVPRNSIRKVFVDKTEYQKSIRWRLKKEAGDALI